MKLQFKHQKFQADAAKAVVDVFAGQPYLTPSYMIDRGNEQDQDRMEGFADDFTGWRNERLIPQLSDDVVLEHIRKVQRANQIEPSERLEGRYNLTIEMETGVGKTYTYIKTMYELNKHYGWTKFIIVVPSIAIREGVYKSFQMTEEHFAEEYGKKIRYFIYNSAQLTEIDRFASDSAINVMIINAQAFNAKGKDARRITMKLDEFRSRRPIDIIAKTNPILIIDEPQSVEGKQTKENIKQFHPMLTLRYSATHRADSIYNMVYRLDAMEAYNKRLVKKIAVKGISESGTTGTEGYVYLMGLDLSQERDPRAVIQFDVRGAKGLRKVTKKVGMGFKLFENSGELDEYKNGYTINNIDGRENANCIEFVNGRRLTVGGVMGAVSEEQLRRLQIRETIESHIQRERQLFHKGIKVLSLFFIDEVAHYKQYDAAGQAHNGVFADMFEEEYNDYIAELTPSLFEGDEYFRYLKAIDASDTHAGYFSIDKKGHIVDTVAGDDKKARLSNDKDAFDLIMKNKERLLDRDPKRSPVRFIFSHSALREGWDNPNVFQICTLKQSSSEVRKRQEVGRGMRLCVNQDGERMDAGVLGNEVHNVNVLTVIASESYESFAKGLQSELSEAVASRPKAVTPELFQGRTLTDSAGNTDVVSDDTAREIWLDLRMRGYIDKAGVLTDKYYADKADGKFEVAEDVKDFADSIMQILDSVYNADAMKPEDARANNVELKLDREKLAMPEFKALWSRINAKSAYIVDFDSEELVRNSITALNEKLRVAQIFFKIETGSMEKIASKDALKAGEAFVRQESKTADARTRIMANKGVKYDLVGRIVEETKLTRKDVVAILTGIQKVVFDQFRNNPEEFIIKASELINEQKATAIIQHITYNLLDERYETDIFTEPTMRGRLGVNAMRAERHLYDHIIYDSENEQEFAEKLDTNTDVAVYVKLPDGFYISTPVGRYNPDWAIAFYEGYVKHIYFIAETKGSMSTMQLRDIESAKIHCAEEHFKAISRENVAYHVVKDYDELLKLVRE